MPAGPTPEVHVEEVPIRVRPVAAVPSSVTAFVGETGGGPVGRPTPVSSFRHFTQEFGAERGDDTLGAVVREFFRQGGERAWIVRSSGRDESAVLDGIYALEEDTNFGLLCLPAPPGRDVGSLDLWAAAAEFCRDQSAFLILDAPVAWDVHRARWQVQDVADALGAARSHAALYYPRLLQAHARRGTGQTPLPACGAVAGVYARVDRTRGVWNAPAGAEARLVGVRGFSRDLDDEVAGRLNAAGVNCLRAFAAQGPVLWGARTLAGVQGEDSAWSHVATRRLALLVEGSLRQGTGWVVFEVNAAPLWRMVRLNIRAFLRDLFRQGAFAGLREEEAFFVKCDAETTSPRDVRAGILNIEVGFAPVRPGEFVRIRIQHACGR